MSEPVKGILYDIQGFSVHDGPGIRTTVYLKGCPLFCLWCHSPESRGFAFDLSYFDMRCVGTEKCGLCVAACPNGAITIGEPEPSLLNETVSITKIKVDRAKCVTCLNCTEVCPAKALTPSGYETTVDEVFQRVCRDRPFFGEDGGVTISGGECMAQFEFTYALAKKCKESGISVCIDTSGFAAGELFDRIIPYTDLFLYDLKHMDSEKSRILTGVPNELILENARRIAKNGGRLQIRIPTIPKGNASEENMRKTAEFCQELGDAVVSVQLLPYHAMGTSKYERLGLNYPLQNVKTPSDEEMQSYRTLMQTYGLEVHIH